MIHVIKCMVLIAITQVPGDGAVSPGPPPVPTKAPPAGVDARLVPPPPPTVTPDMRLKLAASGVVPGGEVYQLPQWFIDLMNLIHKPKPVPVPTPVPTPVLTPPPAPDALPSTAALIQGINEYRASRRLAPFVNDAGLTRVAGYWARQEAVRNEVTHGPGSSFAVRIATVYPNRPASEIAAGDFRSISDVIAAWRSSPGHNAAMLGDYTRAGGGVAVAKDGRWYWNVDMIK